MNNKNKQLGLWMATSLVLGNMIGSGIFLLPATLAPFGGISILGWLLTTVGAMAFALVFAQLSQRYPNTGGLYVYCREEFGESIGFLLAWGYWLGACIGTAAISVAFTSYLSYFIPNLSDSIWGLVCTLGILWILTLVNAKSIISGGILQLITTILKIMPIILISVFGLFSIETSNFTPFNPSNESNFSAILSTASLTLWAFLGLECASIPAGSIENPKRTIPLATVLGTLIAAVIYIASTTAVMGLVEPALLKNSTAPFTDAAFKLWGPAGSLLIGVGAIIACLGAVNGWILIQGQMSYAIAKDHLLPRVFVKTSADGAPSMAIILSSIVSSIIIFMSYSENLISMFSFIFIFSTNMTLITFMFCAIAKILLIAREQPKDKSNLLQIFIAMFAFTYGLFAVGTTDYEVVYWSLIMLLIGLPVYAWVKYHHF